MLTALRNSSLVFLLAAHSYAASSAPWVHGTIRGDHALESSPNQWLITDKATWRNVWSGRLGISGPVPRVDFPREAVVAVLLGSAKTNAAGITISSRTSRADPSRLIVEYEAAPGKDAAAKNTPFVLLKIRSKPVVEIGGKGTLDIADADSITTSTAAAEVASRKGPIRLTLRILRDRIKQGERLWYQIEIKNEGREPFNISDRIFFAPDMDSGEMAAGRTSLIIQPADPSFRNPLHCLDDCAYEPTEDIRFDSSLDEASSRRLDELVARWEKKGLSAEEIDLRVAKELSRRNKGDTAATPKKPAIYLTPGGFIRTPPWSLWTARQRREGQPRLEPVSGYTQLAHYYFAPGTYRISASYDHGVPEGFVPPTKGWKPRPEDANIRTPPIVLEVLP